MRWLSRACLHLALACAVAAGSVVPSAHVHEDHEHHSTVAHRHVSAHDHTGTELSDSDDSVVWLDDGCLHSRPFALDTAVAIAAVSGSIEPPNHDWIATTWDDAAPPHGPPRPASPARAPPCLPSLI